MIDMDEMLMEQECFDDTAIVIDTNTRDDGIDDYMMDDFWERIAG